MEVFMKARLGMFGFVIAFALSAVSFSAAAGSPAAPGFSQATAAPAQPTQAKPKAKKRVTRVAAMRGVPKGTKACVDHLIKMASTEPMTPYEGHPAEIINNGLLWNDPKSRCSVGDDAALRLKVSHVATAWMQKDTEKVKQQLEELKNSLPQT
jgi:hypothetical protein